MRTKTTSVGLDRKIEFAYDVTGIVAHIVLGLRTQIYF